MNEEWIVQSIRSHRMPAQLYVASILIKGTEGTKKQKIVLYGDNPLILQQIVADHNQKHRILAIPK